MAVPVVGMAPSRKASATKACVSAGLIASDEGAWSASSLVAQADDPAALLGTVVACYLDAVGVAAERTLTDEDRARIEWAGAFYGLVEEEAWPTLRAALAMRAPDGEDPVRVLLDAVAWGPLDGARDRAAVLDHRLDVGTAAERSGPLPWLPRVPSRLLRDGEWGDYLGRRSELVRTSADEVRASASGGEPWASGLSVPQTLVGDVAVWRAAHQVLASDERPTGPVCPRAAEARWQPRLDARVEAADAAGRTWSSRAVAFEPQLGGDPGLPKLGRALAALAGEREDAGHLLVEALAEPLPETHAAYALRFRVAGHAAREAPPTRWETVHAPRPTKDQLHGWRPEPPTPGRTVGR